MHAVCVLFEREAAGASGASVMLAADVILRTALRRASADFDTDPGTVLCMLLHSMQAASVEREQTALEASAAFVTGLCVGVLEASEFTARTAGEPWSAQLALRLVAVDLSIAAQLAEARSAAPGPT